MKNKVIASLALCAGLAFAGSALATPHIKIGKGPLNISFTNYPTDVYVVDDSNQTITVTVPTLNINQQAINPPGWAQVYSNNVYDSLYVVLKDTAGNTVYAGYVDNGGLLNVHNQSGNQTLAVTVTQ